MPKTRLDELYEAQHDYSRPINAFANKAKALFNKMARDYGLKTRIHSGEYSDGSARLYLKTGEGDSLSAFGGLISIFALNVEFLATENKKLARLELPVLSVTFHGDEINVNF